MRPYTPRVPVLSRKPPGPRRVRLDSLLATGFLTGLAIVLTALASQGMLGIIVAAAAAAYILLLAVLGREGTGIATLMAAYATAPMYKGIAPAGGSIVTATDALTALGFMLLLPTLLQHRVKLPGMFLLGGIVVFVTGSIASVASDDPTKSYFTLILWLATMIGVPSMIAMWNPRNGLIDTLCWCYVFGQTVNFGVAIVYGPGAQGRYAGLGTHPNYFAQAGLITFCILLYLLWRVQGLALRLLVIGAGVMCGATIYLSGSRAAMVVAAVIIVMIPVVERSAVMGFVYAICGALFVIAIPILVDISGESSALGRLVGGNSSNLSDQARELGQKSGLERFFDRPFVGTGLIDLFDIHNNYLEVAAAIGVFGLVGFLLVIYVFARPLFSDVEHRRLLYVAWAYIGFGATVPGFYDRSIWLPLALGMMAVLEYARTGPWAKTAAVEDRPALTAA